MITHGGVMAGNCTGGGGRGWRGGNGRRGGGGGNGRSGLVVSGGNINIQELLEVQSALAHWLMRMVWVIQNVLLFRGWCIYGLSEIVSVFGV